MTRNDEHTLNTALAESLRRRSPVWQASAEDLDALEGSARPDILVESPTGAPVIVETEFAPAHTVERDAGGRLGKRAGKTGEEIEYAVALRAPQSLREAPPWQLADRVEEAAFEYAVLGRSGAASPADGPGVFRFPETGSLGGGMDDLAGLLEMLAVSERAIAASTDILEKAVARSAERLEKDLRDRPEPLRRIAEYLHQEPGLQTRRMAMAILANACTFHAAVAGAYDIRDLGELRLADGTLPRDSVLREWKRILRINYWPIFRIACEILRLTPSRPAARVLDVVAEAADGLTALGANSSHDLTGRMFQRLITDRKFLATFYTRPEAATLLADLAVGMTPVDWSDPEAMASYRIADLACGTGTLLSAAYQSLIGRFRRAGHDDRETHAAMMENSLIAADIMPASTHLTASMLSSVHPAVIYGRTQVYTLPYGGKSGGRPFLGSLSLLEGERMPSLFGGGLASEIEGLGGAGAETVSERELQSPSFALADESLDLVIMNPPFTRPTNHEGTAENVPSFAGFGTSEAEQKAMSEELKRLRAVVRRRRGAEAAPPASHGNAGLASNFLDLAHEKLRPGGILALVMPASLPLGASWGASRNLLARHYRRVLFLTVAAANSEEKAFSADTGMAEVLILAEKRESDSVLDKGEADGDATWISLRKRPGSAAEAAETARALRQALEEAPDAEGAAFPVRLGGEHAGSGIRASVSDGGCAGVADMDLAAVAMALGRGRLRRLRRGDDSALPIVPLAVLGERGPLDRDIGGRRDATVTARGPFEIHPRTGVPTYPVLWSHHSERERRLEVAPDSMGRARAGRERAAAAVWKTATRLHFNRDFRTNAQSLAACLTPEPALGGRAWPSFRPEKPEWEPALAAWANTTLGLLLFWWIGSVQQSGRTNLTLSRLGDLLVPDLRALPPERVERIGRAAEDLRGEKFLEAHRAAEDPTRQELDRRVLGRGLGFDEETLREVRLIGRKWCAEPTVHGGKLPAVRSFE